MKAFIIPVILMVSGIMVLVLTKGESVWGAVLFVSGPISLPVMTFIKKYVK